MLTPKQVKDFSFQAAGRNAYKASEVDEFLDEVYESYEQMFRENGELVKKLNLVADKLQTYKSDEDNIRNALLTAERMKESIVAEAQEQIKGILKEAEDKAAEIVADAEKEADDTLKIAQTNATKLLAKAQEIYDDQVGTIKEEAEKEEAYLLKIKEESVKVREDLLDSYKKQIQILEYTPDFSEEVRAAHAPAVVEEEEEEVEEEIEEVADEEAVEEEAAEEEPEVEVEIEYADDPAASIDEYLDGDVEDIEDADETEYEDIDSGEDLFADEDEKDDKEISLF